jgi:hypothetical protein
MKEPNFAAGGIVTGSPFIPESVIPYTPIGGYNIWEEYRPDDKITQLNK